jgi:hypothetical protein
MKYSKQFTNLLVGTLLCIVTSFLEAEQPVSGDVVATARERIDIFVARLSPLVDDVYSKAVGIARELAVTCNKAQKNLQDKKALHLFKAELQDAYCGGFTINNAQKHPYITTGTIAALLLVSYSLYAVTRKVYGQEKIEE